MNKAIAAEALTLKLHVGGGMVWQTAGTELARCTNLPPEAYVKTATRWEKFDSVRLLGAYDNASLISGLFGRIRVDLVTPMVCPSKSLRKDPQAVLFYMRGCMLAPSQGGYHQMTAPESLVYKACAAARMSKKIEDAVPILQAHPLWQPVHFLRNINDSFLASVILAALDPRWFVDTCAPDRAAKLMHFFGMDPPTQAGALGLSSPQRYDAKCKLALHTWYEQAAAREVLTRHMQLGGLTPVYNATERGLAPGDALWRVWMNAYDKRRSDPSVAATYGTLRASQMLLNFLRQIWLSTIYRDSPSIPDGGAVLFRPRDFFRFPVEARAFDAWCD
jgi:hypothetical protein